MNFTFNNLYCSSECKFKTNKKTIERSDEEYVCILNSNLRYPVDIPPCLSFQFEDEFFTFTS